MRIYEHRTSQTTASGTASSTSLKVIGGILQNVLVLAATTNTTFRFDLVDDNNITRLRWGYHVGEINESNIGFPMVGEYTCNITNSSANDTFDVILGIEE